MPCKAKCDEEKIGKPLTGLADLYVLKAVRGAFRPAAAVERGLDAVWRGACIVIYLP